MFHFAESQRSIVNVRQRFVQRLNNETDFTAGIGGIADVGHRLTIDRECEIRAIHLHLQGVYTGQALDRSL